MKNVDLTSRWLRAIFNSSAGTLDVRSSDGGVCTVVGWPLPTARVKIRRGSPWVRCLPKLFVRPGPIEDRIAHLEVATDKKEQILLPFAVAAKDRGARANEVAWLRWSATIPVREREFVSRVSSCHWELLKFFADSGSPALDLATSSPALAFALATGWAYRRSPAKRSLRVTRALLAKKQREIVGRLGLPATESSRKIFRKIPHETVGATALRMVAKGMSDPEILQLMRHLQRLNAGTLRVLVRPDLFRCAAVSLLEEVSMCPAEDRRPQAPRVLQDIVQMVRAIGPVLSPPRPVRSLVELQALHDELAEVLNRLDDWMLDAPFPPPPIEGSAHIVPITNAFELVREARAQKSCLASYVEKVITGHVYIYTVMAAERCTLALLRYEDCWVPGEFRSVCNNEPSEVSVRAVEEWIAGAAGRPVMWARLVEEEDLPF